MNRADPDWDKLESAAPPPGRPVLDSLAPAFKGRQPGWAIVTRSTSAIKDLKSKIPAAWIKWNAQGNYWWVALEVDITLREIFANYDQLVKSAPAARLL